MGQIGTELALTLIDRYGRGNIVLSDIRPLDNSRKKSGNGLFDDFPYYRIDCRDRKALSDIVKQYKFSRIYHLAALLSATSEKNPQTAWDINVTGLCNILELARETGCEVFTPSSIAAFGPTTIRDFTPQDTTQRPTSIYGISKVTGELLCDYYYHKYGVDTRGVRYPGIISSLTPPGGGTTDYAVEIFYAAVKEKRYVCPLRDDTRLDMMYMPDAVKAAVDIMEADPERLRHRNAFNVSSFSFCPEDLAAYIRKYIPEFVVTYSIDPVRQALADSWPNSIEDYAARVEWGWSPDYDVDAMTRDMLQTLSTRGRSDAVDS